jgi:Endoribonuclease GhoS
MAQYIARVELHAASYSNYEFLNSQMAQQGFVRTLVGVNCTTYQLPIGTYVLSSNIALQEVLNRAVAAANATLKSSAVVVAEWREAMWQGLTVVQ